MPYFANGGYSRSPVPAGKIEQFKKHGKIVCLVYENSERKLDAALDRCPKEDVVILMNGKDKFKVNDHYRFVHITGECKDHPFAYDAKPEFISFCRSLDGLHRNMVHDLKEVRVIEVMAVKVEMYSGGKDNNRIHYIVHVPDILVLREPWLEGLMAALIKPFEKSIRMLEPYIVGRDENLRNTLFYRVMTTMGKQFIRGVTAWDLRLQSGTYESANAHVKGCGCEACVKYREHHTFTHVEGGMQEIHDKRDF